MGSVKGMTGTTEDNQRQSDEIGPKSEVSSNDNTVGEWLIPIDHTCDPKSKKKRVRVNSTQIDRVLTRLRESKQYTNCFDPLVVSIGPYHFGKQRLKEFEELKLPIARKLCRLYYKDKENALEQLYSEVVNHVGDTAVYYEKDSSGNLNRMVFLDACFVLYFIFFSEKKVCYNCYNCEIDEQEEVDAQLNKSYYLVLRDLFLLENQIPFSVIKAFMGSLESVKEVITNFIVDFSRLLMPHLPTERQYILNFDESPHLLHLVREIIQPSSLRKAKCKSETIGPSLARQINFRESYRSVTDLISAGIYFKPSKIGNLTDVKFESCIWFSIVTLPSIKVDHLTKPLLLNLVAYELCPHGPLDTRITSYICLMDSLIDHADDVKELRRKRILVNKLGSDEHLAQLFNEIANDLIPVNDPREYVLAKRMIDKHCTSKSHIWMAKWVHKYFSIPWTLLAFLGAILILALTMAQTYFAAYPPVHSHNKTS